MDHPEPEIETEETGIPIDDESLSNDQEQESNATTSTDAEAKRFTKTRPFTNPVHRWFVDDSGNSKCTLCLKILTGKYPSTLTAHLRAKHTSEFKEYDKLNMERKNRTLTDSSGHSKKPRPSLSSLGLSLPEHFRRISEKKVAWKPGSNTYEKAVQSIAIGFVANSLLCRIIEDPSIKKMFATVSDGHLANLPRRQELSSKIGTVVKEMQAFVKSAIQNAQYVSLTLDLWSRPGYASGMMGVTCHYFDRKLHKVMTVLLACRTIKQPHTGANIYNLYNSIRVEWDLDESRILRIVTDNGSNVVNAFKDCLLVLVKEQRRVSVDLAADIDHNLEESFSVDEEDEFDDREAGIDGQFSRKQRISCFAHNLMLVVKRAVDDSTEIKSTKEKIEDLIAKITVSPKVLESVKEKSGGLGLLKPVRTKWIYWYYVFDRILRLKRIICEVCDELNVIHDLGPLEWKIVQEVKDLMEPFTLAVTRLEGDSYATISEVYPVLFSLKSGLRQLERQPIRGSVLKMSKLLMAQLDVRFERVLKPSNENFDPIYLLASFLDPRYGLLLEGEYLEIAEAELKLMVRTQEFTFSNEQLVRTNDDEAMVENPVVRVPQSDVLAAAIARINERRRSDPAGASQPSIDREIVNYVTDLKQSESISANPFDFWIKRSQTSPSMSSLALDVLVVPATSAPSERVFSRASFVLEKNRHNLSDQKLEWELFFKINRDYFDLNRM